MSAMIHAHTQVSSVSTSCLKKAVSTLEMVSVVVNVAVRVARVQSHAKKCHSWYSVQDLS